MASKFHEDVLKIVVGQICQNIGFHGIFSSSVDVLVDLLHRYLRDIAVTTHRYTEHYGRTDANLDDLGLAFREMGISVKELEEYISFVEPLHFPHKVPQLPVPQTSNLNFLKPGAREDLISSSTYS
ncbi:Transcription initiation factor TFIID subunit 3 [Armadillidium nasatum]|uniref:Transcription initiation factor TFIID subunit 3 n=1 Tax=Armadillidium nasatum TaxID=96803 RepID=A0A5N5SU75_9CRUS|nr:Transcription initiation factor TFIID subunit 3 [Armadillidium nasatum]